MTEIFDPAKERRKHRAFVKGQVHFKVKVGKKKKIDVLAVEVEKCAVCNCYSTLLRKENYCSCTSENESEYAVILSDLKLARNKSEWKSIKTITQHNKSINSIS